MADMPETRFTRAGDVDIAYQVTGAAGGLDVVVVPGWVSQLEVMWELPEFARFLDRLAAIGRLIVFDKRGTGLSDRVAGTPPLDTERRGGHAAVGDAVRFGAGTAIDPGPDADRAPDRQQPG
jgi:pimeloyl-ACP methyl ester carboxylesterase